MIYILKTHDYTINRYIFREMDSSNQPSFEGLQAIHVEEQNVFDALYSKEQKALFINFNWAQGRHEKMMAAQKRYVLGKRALKERHEQVISELRKVYAEVHARSQEREQARVLRQEHILALEKARVLRKERILAWEKARVLRHTQRNIQEQSRLYTLTLRQTASDLDEVPMIFPVIIE